METCTRGCQHSSFTNTQDIQNVLVGILLENEQSKDPVIVHDGGQFSGDLTDEEWKTRVLFEEPMGSMLTPRVQVHWMQTALLIFG